MTLVVWETLDSFESKNVIWSGFSYAYPSGINLYSDIFDLYIVGLHSSLGNYLTVIDKVEGDYTVIDASPPSETREAIMTHYLNEIGYAQYSAYVEISGSKMFISYYPENTDGWQIVFPINVSGESNLGVDIVFPDTPNSPRFLVGTKIPGSAIIVMLADDPLLMNRYPSTFIGFIPSGILTDIEAMRFI
jgi:hypothetical protein